MNQHGLFVCKVWIWEMLRKERKMGKEIQVYRLVQENIYQLNSHWILHNCPSKSSEDPKETTYKGISRQFFKSIHLCRKAELPREGARQVFHLMVQTKARSKYSTQVSYVVAGVSLLRPVFAALPGTLTASLNESGAARIQTVTDMRCWILTI